MNKFSYPLNLPFLVSQKWNENPEYYNKIGMKGHNGWDFSVPEGTKVFAVHDGTVWFSGVDGTMSNTILIDTIDGTLRTAYAHLSILKVNNGDKVKKGQLIALSGNTGRYTSGPHLHFGVHTINNYSDIDRYNGYNGCVDPAKYWDGSYPSSSAVRTTEQTTAFLAMQKAILDFQVAVGIKDFVGKQLSSVVYGEKTKQAVLKIKSQL